MNVLKTLIFVEEEEIVRISLVVINVDVILDIQKMMK